MSNNKSGLREKPKHSIVFEEYYKLGDKRSLTKLSDKTGYSMSTLSKWKNEFDWDSKIDNRDKGELEIIQRDRLQANLEARSIYQDTIRQMMKEQVIDPLMNGTLDIQIKNVTDIKKLIELDNMLSREDKEDNRQAELSDKDKEVINLIENDTDTWEMLTNKLRENKSD